MVYTDDAGVPKARSPAEVYAAYMKAVRAGSRASSTASTTPRATEPSAPPAVPSGHVAEPPHRRLLKPKPYYGDDAAGVTSEQRNLARPTPLKGRGVPPPEQNEARFAPGKRAVPGRSWAAHPNILHHHHHHHAAEEGAPHTAAQLLTQSVDSALFGASLLREEASPREAMAFTSATSRPGTAHSGRTCLKMTELSHRASLKGPGLSIIAEDPAKRPLRKPGTAAPTGNTKARVLVLSEDAFAASPFATADGPEAELTPRPSGPPANNAREAALNVRWSRQLFEAGLTDSISSSALPQRPSTAPAAGGANEARLRYHLSSTAHADVLTYRHSGAICGSDWKLDGSRTAAPHLVQHSADAAREAYYASRAGYATSRVRSMLSQRTYA